MLIRSLEITCFSFLITSFLHFDLLSRFFFQAYSSYSLSFKRVEKEGRKNNKGHMAGRYWQSPSLSLWARLFDVFQSGSIPLKMKRGCASTPLTELPLLHIMSKGETGGFRVSISRAAMSLKQLSPGSSWCLQLLNLLLATILNVNVWLQSYWLLLYFFTLFFLYSFSASKQNQNMFCQAKSKRWCANDRQQTKMCLHAVKELLHIFVEVMPPGTTWQRLLCTSGQGRSAQFMKQKSIMTGPQSSCHTTLRQRAERARTWLLSR